MLATNDDNDHQINDHNNNNDLYFCVLCDTITADADDMRQHLRQHVLLTDTTAAEADDDNNNDDNELSDEIVDYFVGRFVQYQYRLNRSLSAGGGGGRSLSSSIKRLPESGPQILFKGCPVCDAIIRCHQLFAANSQSNELSCSCRRTKSRPPSAAAAAATINSSDKRYIAFVMANSETTAAAKRSDIECPKCSSTAAAPMSTAFKISELIDEPFDVRRHHCYQHLSYYPFVCQFVVDDDDDDGGSGGGHYCGRRYFTYKSSANHLRSDHSLVFDNTVADELIGQHFDYKTIDLLEDLIDRSLNPKCMATAAAVGSPISPTPSLSQVSYSGSQQSDSSCGIVAVKGTDCFMANIGLFANNNNNKHSAAADNIDNGLYWRENNDPNNNNLFAIYGCPQLLAADGGSAKTTPKNRRYLTVTNNSSPAVTNSSITSTTTTTTANGSRLSPPAIKRRRLLLSDNSGQQSQQQQRWCLSNTAATATSDVYKFDDNNDDSDVVGGDGIGAVGNDDNQSSIADSIDLSHNINYLNWFTETRRTKTPYFPQNDDTVYYIPYGHELYRSAVLKRNIYGLANNNQSLRYWRTAAIESKVAKIDFEFKESKHYRTVVRCVYITLRPMNPTYGLVIHVKYHDLPVVDDFVVLKEHYECGQRIDWKIGHQVRAVRGGGGGGQTYWRGIVVGFDWQPYNLVSRFRSLRVQWFVDQTVSLMSPWDLEMIVNEDNKNDDDQDTEQPSSGHQSDVDSMVPITDEDRDRFFTSDPNEWPNFDEKRELKRLATGLKIILMMDKTQEFPILADLTDNRYREKILYPIDLKTLIARVENRYYRRHSAIKYDIKFMESNIRKLVKSVRRDPDYRFDAEIGRRLKYHTKFVVALALLFIDTRDCRNPYDLYHNIDEYLETHDIKFYSAKRPNMNRPTKRTHRPIRYKRLPPQPSKQQLPQSFGVSSKKLRIYQALANTGASGSGLGGQQQRHRSSTSSSPSPQSPFMVTINSRQLTATPIVNKKLHQNRCKSESKPKSRPPPPVLSAAVTKSTAKSGNNNNDNNVKKRSKSMNDINNNNNSNNTTADDYEDEDDETMTSSYSKTIYAFDSTSSESTIDFQVPNDLQMYSSDVSVSLNEYNYPLLSDTTGDDDEDNNGGDGSSSSDDPDFKLTHYQKERFYF
ncbi:uncharacterized protein LOC128956807 [Oppia nitens]|uniref:uncharacterized protein LOC128956807 n=1 Tax=Oppia nitens TaxID=1686743 RepID=UPI0023DB1219|nr:uncharacterized protein LOC128956807 [Oppia nitens]